MAEAKPKVSIKIRVMHGAKPAGDWGKLYDDSVTVQTVVEWSMQRAAAYIEQSLTFERIESCFSEDALDRRGTVLDGDDLSEMSVAHLRDSFGRFLKVYCSTGAASPGTPTQLPSAFGRLHETQQKEHGQLMLPTSPSGDHYEYRLQRALLLQLEKEGLGFTAADAISSGKDLVRLLAKALQYLLPSDDVEPSPLRLDGRIHLVVPARFKAEVPLLD